MEKEAILQDGYHPLRQTTLPSHGRQLDHARPVKAPPKVRRPFSRCVIAASPTVWTRGDSLRVTNPYTLILPHPSPKPPILPPTPPVVGRSPDPPTPSPPLWATPLHPSSLIPHPSSFILPPPPSAINSACRITNCVAPSCKSGGYPYFDNNRRTVRRISARTGATGCSSASAPPQPASNPTTLSP